MMIRTYLRTAGERIAASWLDKPIPISLEFLAVTGERQIKREDNQTYFVYELLTASGKRYESKRKGFNATYYGILRLPQSVTREKRPHCFKGKLRQILRPQEYAALEQDRQNLPLDEALKAAYHEAGFKEEVHGVSIAGIDEDNLHTLLYIPGTTAPEADGKVQQYQQRVNALLQPRKLSCNYKIRPIVKKN